MRAGKGIHVEYVPGTFRPKQNKDNDYLIDRAAQKRGETFSGVFGIAMQDASLQESMGPIIDRTKENLVSTDNGIIMARHRLLRAVKAHDRERRRAGRPRRGASAMPLGRSGAAPRGAFQGRGEGRVDGAAGYGARDGLMLSESARMSTAAEARFRIETPNSRPRAVKVVALDSNAEAIMDTLALNDWNGAAFFRAGELTRSAERLSAEVDEADVVVMIITAGEPAADVEAIGRACSRRRVTTTGLIVGSSEVPDEELARTLARVRPWTLMLVIANSTEYVADMLRALRA